MGKKKKRVASNVWCYYCDREFDDEKILVQHQNANHFKCHVCNKKLSTASGMAIHVLQVHKESVTKVPNAKSGRERTDIDVFGMQGIPPDVLAAHYGDEEEETLSKAAKVDSLYPQMPGTVPGQLGVYPPLSTLGAVPSMYGSAVPPGLAAYGQSPLFPVQTPCPPLPSTASPTLQPSQVVPPGLPSSTPPVPVSQPLYPVVNNNTSAQSLPYSAPVLSTSLPTSTSLEIKGSTDINSNPNALLTSGYHIPSMQAANCSLPAPTKWRKVAYGGMQRGYDDNHTDETFLEAMVMNANVVKRDIWKVMQDSVSISQYLCIVSLVVLVWTYTLGSTLDENSLLLLDISLLGSGFLILLLTEEMLSFNLLFHYILNISFFITGLYVLAPIYHTLTRSISSDSIWAVAICLLMLHLFLHDYSGSTIKAPGALKNPSLTSCISLNASVVASVFIASRLPSRLHVFAIILFSLLVFLFSPLVTYCVKKYSFRLHLVFSFTLMVATLSFVYMLHKLHFVLLLGLLVFVNVVCPYWLIRIQEYKFEINGPWDEAKLCFEITD